ncbi:Hpt domain-containing protein, partial [Escherichia coli]|uniref:Hpt domain-containing protein n=1 Tax=Escherichia coli TaxID=562 RepID=UPI001E6147D8
LAAGNLRDLKAVLHRMRGGFGAVQAMALYQQAEAAEARLGAGKRLTDPARGQVTALAGALRAMLAALYRQAARGGKEGRCKETPK